MNRRPESKMWRVLRAIEAAGDAGINGPALCAALDLTKQQIKGIVFYLRTREGRAIISQREFGGAALYRIQGDAAAPILPKPLILSMLKEAAPAGVSVAQFRERMSLDTLRKSMVALRKEGLIFDKRSHAHRMRYWLTAEDRDAQLAAESAAVVAVKSAREPKQARPAKARKPPEQHQKLTIKPPRSYDKLEPQPVTVPANVKRTVCPVFVDRRFVPENITPTFSGLRLGSYYRDDTAIARAYGEPA